MKILMACVLMIITGCATTKVTSSKDTSYANKQYTKLAIAVLGNDLIKTKELEKAFKKRFEKSGITMLLGTDLFQPTRQYTADQAQKILSENGAEAVLLVNLTSEKHQSQNFTPKTDSTTRINAAGQIKTSTDTSGGGTYSQYSKGNQISLIDVPTKHTVWVATSHSTGSVYSSSVLVSILSPSILKGMMTNSLADKIYKQLAQDALVASARQP